MSNIENLLRRHAEGTLTPEEQSELNRLTHRDQVFEAAGRRATQLRRKQYYRLSAIASVLVVGGFLYFMRPTVGGVQSGPMMAEVSSTEVANPQVEDWDVEIKANETVHSEFADKKTPEAPSEVKADTTPSRYLQHHADKAEALEELTPATMTAPEPVVACNTDCSADSVINDIWKFLRA